ncbi:MAG: 50S ribosomal protein L17 [Desulfobacterales bacterium]|nr:MAG: 50S ribosomal protein L17 [Desulfobacterales bacterium]
MRHRKAGLKLNRTTSHRNAMFRNMVTSLFKYERIRTTAAKAKELRRWADHLITLAKRGDLHARRQALSIVREKKIVHKLFEETVGRFGASSGGYTRIVKLGRRPGDAAPISLVELVIPEEKPKKKRTKKRTAKAEVEKKKAEAPEKPAAAEKAEKPEKEEKKAKRVKAVTDKKETKSETKAKRAPSKKAAEDEKEEKPEVKAKQVSKKRETAKKEEAKK